MRAATAATAERVRSLLARREPTLGAGRLVCVDGPAGSGKTTLAASLGAPTVHMDDLYPGWEGLDRVAPAVLDLLGPLSEGRPGHYRRYDWDIGEYAEEHRVAPVSVLVLEGVGSGARAWADLITVLVWLEADPEIRLRRGLERDGEAVRAHWLRWMSEERRHFEREGTRERADLVVRT